MVLAHFQCCVFDTYAYLELSGNLPSFNIYLLLCCTSFNYSIGVSFDGKILADFAVSH